MKETSLDEEASRRAVSLIGTIMSDPNYRALDYENKVFSLAVLETLTEVIYGDPHEVTERVRKVILEWQNARDRARRMDPEVITHFVAMGEAEGLSRTRSDSRTVEISETAYSFAAKILGIKENLVAKKTIPKRKDSNYGKRQSETENALAKYVGGSGASSEDGEPHAND